MFAIAAYLMSTESKLYGLIMLLSVIIIVIFSLNRLGYLEAKKQKVYLGDQTLIRVRKQMAPLSMDRFWHKLMLVFTDIVAINLSLAITYWFRFYSGIYQDIGSVPPAIAPAATASIIFTIFFTGLFALNGLYNIRWDLSRFDIVLRLSRVITFGAIIIFIITIDPDQMISPSRLTIVFYSIFLILLINGFRLTLIFIEKHFSILEYTSHKTLLVGTSEKAKKILKDIRRNKHLLYDIIGVVTKEAEGKSISNLKNIGTYEDIPKLILEHGVEEIIIAINERSRDEILNIVAYGENMRVNFKIIPQMYDVISGHKTEAVIGHPLIRLFPDQMLPWQWIIKRITDFTAAVSGLIIMLPIFLIIFMLQLATGIYPFFVIENKVGKQGKMFGQLLFNINKRKNSIGKMLYHTHIYKLPQVFNLLIGSISLVGPRPESLELVEELRGRIKFYNRRFMVRPGITGWTQVKYRYSESLKHLKEQFKHDLFYLENMSLLFDMRIILRSIFIFFFRK
jgi:lipopolysaccharide/colanic/teichoic acid biosynthesis glycosyltransferase